MGDWHYISILLNTQQCSKEYIYKTTALKSRQVIFLKQDRRNTKHKPVSVFQFFFFNVYLFWERESMHAREWWGWAGGGGAERESPTISVLCCQHGARQGA